MWFTAAAMFIAVGAAGCGAAWNLSQSSGEVTNVASAGHVDPRIDGLIDTIAEVGMTDWADYGRDLQRRGRIRVVTTDELDPKFNAFAFIDKECIWYSEIAFERYDHVDQAEILLHEMVHLRTGEITHQQVSEVCGEYRRRAAAKGLT